LKGGVCNNLFHNQFFALWSWAFEQFFMDALWNSKSKPTFISFNHDFFATPWVEMMSFGHNAITHFASQNFFYNLTFYAIRHFSNWCFVNVFAMGYELMVGYHFYATQH
jgi:hypothetical protein